MSELILYYRPGCSYCEKVLSFTETKKINLILKDIRNPPSNRDELFQLGGKGQVPCLNINGKALYESVDIINWLDKNFKT